MTTNLDNVRPITPRAVDTGVSRPTKPGEWSIDQIISALSRDIPTWLTKSKEKGGATIEFVPWYRVSRLMDKYAPGWTWEITNVSLSSDRIFVTGRLSIPAAEGTVYREAMGSECLKVEKPIRIETNGRAKEYLREPVTNRVVTEPAEIPYGDPATNSESMAFRRCAARFGFGLSSYEKGKIPSNFYRTF